MTRESTEEAPVRDTAVSETSPEEVAAPSAEATVGESSEPAKAETPVQAADAPAAESTDAPPADAPDAPAAEAADAKADAAKDEVELKRTKALQARVASLYRAARSSRPMEGRVESVIKGGYEVRINKVRAFCPHSQIDVQRHDDPEQHVGKTYTFRITQIRRGGDDVIVSRRALLEDEQREQRTAVLATLVEGNVMQGQVAGLADFGAFVDLGAGVTGLVHISELSHSRVRRVQDAVTVGNTVPVKILSIDDKKGRISLSIRQAQEDPWASAGERFTAGTAYPGTVVRLADFGCFVRLAEGIEALAPASEFPPASDGWRAGLDVGAERRWLALSVDPDKRRISVTPVADGVDAVDLAPPTVDAEVQGSVQRVEKFGVFVWLGPGRVGLMPGVWSGTRRGADLAREFPVGSGVDVRVVEVTEEGRRIRLARKGVDTTAVEAPARDERRPRRERGERTERRDERAASSSSDGGGSFGTILADKLKAVLGDRPGAGD